MKTAVAESGDRDPIVDPAMEIAPSWGGSEVAVELPEYLVRHYDWACL